MSFGSLGRFMFADIPQVPGLELMPHGFRVAHTVADTVYFSAPLRDLRVKRIAEGEAVFQGRDYVYAPGAVRYSPWRPGVELYFPLDFRLTMRTDLGPFLTWADGSVGVDVPTAASRWHMLSFRDGQAPILFVFEEPVQLLIGGESGNWTLRCSAKIKGWVRIMAPVGPERVSANVSALGALAKRVGGLAEEVCRPMPTLVNFELRNESGFVTAIWNFDRVGAMIPAALMLCRAGGYDARISTGISASRGDLVEGPMAFSREPRIVVRFPVVRIPAGQSLMVGKFENVVSSASGFDIPSVVELALSRFGSGRDELTEDAVATSLGEYRRALPTYSDLITGQSSAVPRNGNGVDLLAAQALLELSDSGGTEFLGQVADRWDPWCWRIAAEKPEVSLRATGLFSVAAVLAGDSQMRVKGAMAQAGMAAENVRGDYLRRRQFGEMSGKLVQPLKALRDSLFGDAAMAPNRENFVSALMSPVRILGSRPVTVERSGGLYILSWEHREGEDADLVLLTEFPIEVEARENLASIIPDGFLAETRLRVTPKGVGRCSVALRLPGWVVDLPPVVAAPRYSE